MSSLLTLFTWAYGRQLPAWAQLSHAHPGPMYCINLTLSLSCYVTHRKIFAINDKKISIYLTFILRVKNNWFHQGESRSIS